MKKFLCLILVLIMICPLGLPASAAVKEEIDPMYVYVSSVSAGLTIDESTGVASCTGHILSKKSAPVKVLIRLQQYTDGAWKTLNSWTVTGTWVATDTKYYAVYSGYQYRVYVTGYVYNDEGMIIESASVIDTYTYPKK